MFSIFGLIAGAIAGARQLHNPYGPNIRALRRRSEFSSRSPSKYQPHDGKRQQERHRLQRQRAMVVVGVNRYGSLKFRHMNAWLARNRSDAFGPFAKGGAQ